MTTTTTTATARRTKLAAAVLTLGALVTGGAVMTATPVLAQNSGDTRSGSASSEIVVPGDGVAGPEVAAVAPDGTRIAGFSSVPHGTEHAHRPDRATAQAAGQVQALSGVNVTFTVNGARLRASVPTGRTIALAYTSTTAYAGCKIPGSDGYVWGWIDAYTSAGWRQGWVRQDLWYVTQTTSPRGGNGLPQVPWC